MELERLAELQGLAELRRAEGWTALAEWMTPVTHRREAQLAGVDHPGAPRWAAEALRWWRERAGPANRSGVAVMRLRRPYRAVPPSLVVGILGPERSAVRWLGLSPRRVGYRVTLPG